MPITDPQPIAAPPASVRPLLAPGVGFMIVSTACFSLMQTLIKVMPQFNSFQHIFFRSVIGWLLCVGVLRARGISIQGKNSRMLVMRGVIGSVSMFSFFYVLPRVPFATSVTLKYLSPIFTAIFAYFLLQERIRPVQWVSILLSFVGVVLLKGFDPRIGLWDLSIGLISAVSGGLLYIVIKKIGDDDHPLVILHYFMGISTLASGVLCLGVWRNPNLTEWTGLLAIGVVGFFAQNYFTKAVQAAERVSSLASVRYLEAAYALVIGFFLFNETYNALSFLGLLLIFGGLFLSMALRKLRPESD